MGLEFFDKNIIASISAILLLAGYLPYIISIYKGRTQPHFYSWLSWAITTNTVFMVQLMNNAGIGVLTMLISGIACSYICLLAFQRRHAIKITNSDRVVLIIALSTLPIWIISGNGLLAVGLSAFNIGLSYIPTIRKTFINPYNENLTLHMMCIIAYALAALAVETYTLANIIYPAALAVMIAAFVCMAIIRQQAMKPLLQPALQRALNKLDDRRRFGLR